MNRTSYIVGPLLATALVACKPSPRYTLTEATDPKTGTRTAYRINTETGAAELARWMEPDNCGAIRFWEPVEDRKTALEMVKAIQTANKANAKQAAEIKAGTFTY